MGALIIMNIANIVIFWSPSHNRLGGLFIHLG
jgi:hypothetical protein